MNGECGPTSKWPCGEPPYRPADWNSTATTHNCYAYMLNDLMMSDRVGKSQPGAYNDFKRKMRGYSGMRKLNCREAVKGVMRDNPHHIKVFTLEKGSRMKPKAKHYKGFLMVGPGQDFHFARQDNRMLRVYNAMFRNAMNSADDRAFLRTLLAYSKRLMPDIYRHVPKSARTIKSKLRFLYKNSKTWSHKPGSTPVSDRDADGRLIFDPLKANWDYSKKGGVNYSHNCCFFEIPMNTHKPTHSSGVKNLFSVGRAHTDLESSRARTNISTSKRQQTIDARVRKLLGIR